MTKAGAPKAAKSQKRTSRKRAKEAAAGAAVLGAAAAMTANDLMKDEPGDQVSADPASFDAAAASLRQGSAPAGTGGVAPRDVGTSAPSPAGARGREGTAATAGPARGSGGSSAGAGPAQDPGSEGLQSIGSEAQGSAGEEEEEYGHTGTESPWDMLFPGEPIEDAHQDLVEALPEGTGDALLRAGLLGVGPAAVIEAADATGVLDDTQDRVNEQIEDFLYDDDTQNFGMNTLEVLTAPSKGIGDLMSADAPEFVGKAQDDVEDVFSDGGDLLKELDPSHTPPVEAVSEAYWDAQWVVDREGKRVIDQLDEGAIADELGRAVDTVGDAAQDAGDAIEDAAEDTGEAIEDAAEDTGEAIEDAVGDANPFD
jgi:hypothetical protein